VGAYQKRNGGNMIGGAYIFKQDAASGDWYEYKNMVDNVDFDGDSGDRVGISVSLHGDSYVAGSVWDDECANNCGAVQLWETDGGSLVNTRLVSSRSYRTKGIGNSVDINGKLIISGSRQNQYVKSGIVEVWEYDDVSGSWDNTVELLPDEGIVNDYYGWSVSIGCDCAIIGSHEDDISGKSNSGAAYVVCGFDTCEPKSVCDSISGNTSPLYRSYEPNVYDHYYTTDEQEHIAIQNMGYFAERSEGYLWNNEIPGVTVPLKRFYCRECTDTLLTIDETEVDKSKYYLDVDTFDPNDDGIIGHIMTQPCPGITRPLHKYYAGGAIQDHFYTTDYNQLRGGNAHYVYEGVYGYVSTV